MISSSSPSQHSESSVRISSSSASPTLQSPAARRPGLGEERLLDSLKDLPQNGSVSVHVVAQLNKKIQYLQAALDFEKQRNRADASHSASSGVSSQSLFGSRSQSNDPASVLQVPPVVSFFFHNLICSVYFFFFPKKKMILILFVII